MNSTTTQRDKLSPYKPKGVRNLPTSQVRAILFEVVDDPNKDVIVSLWEELTLYEKKKYLTSLNSMVVLREVLDVARHLGWEPPEELRYVENLEKYARPPCSVVAKALAILVVKEAELIAPVYAHIGESGEYGLVDGNVIYGEEELQDVCRILSSIVHGYASSQLYNPLLAELKALRREIPRESINPITKVNHKNGVVDLETLEIHQNDPYHYFTYKIPQVDETLLLNIKNGVLREEAFRSYSFYQVIRKHYSDEEWVKLKRVLGSILVPFSLKLLAFVVGEPNTRKSFLASLLAKTGLLAVTSLKMLTENPRFALQHAVGARGLLCEEEAETIVRHQDIINQVTGGGPIYIDRKGKPPIQLPETTWKMIVFTNKIPIFKNITDQLVDRTVIVETTNPEIPSAEERELINRALSDQFELKAFIAFLYFCYRELRESKYEIPEKGSEKVRCRLEWGASNVVRFLESGEVEVKVGCEVKGTELYEAYVSWCASNGEEALSRNTFYDHMVKYGAEYNVKRIKKENQVYFKNITVRKEDSKTIELYVDQ